MKPASLFLWPALVALAACSPEDRSGEVPFAPAVRTAAPCVEGRRVRMEGEILSSPNSTVTKRGFNYGNDTLRAEVLSTDTADCFRAQTDELQPGRYFCVAFATNGVGTGRGDTLYFDVAGE